MAQTHSLALPEVLSQEFEALRPGSSYQSSQESELFRQVHAEQKPLSALCISGGGIRSATFALGALEGLAELGLLPEFDYLSTVSGGGYIGSWLTSWKHRAGGLDKVVPYLCAGAPEIPRGDPDPVEHLREYNSYLSPRLGLFSVDTWTLAATMMRNMLLNWLVFIPLLMAALLLPRLVLSLAQLGETFPEYYPWMANALDASVLSPVISIISAVLFGVAILNTMRYLPGVGGVEHSEFDFLKWVLLPILLSSLAFITNDSWFTGNGRPGTNHTQLLGYQAVVLGAMGSAALAILGCFLTCRKRLRLRFWFGVAATVLLGACLAGSAAWLVANYIYPSTGWQGYTTCAVSLLLVTILLSGCMFVGFSSVWLKDEDREWLSRAGAWILLFIVTWSGFCVLVLFVPAWIMPASFPVWAKSLFGAVGGTGGVLSALAGRSRKSAATRSAGAQPTSQLMSLAMALGAPAFAITVLAGLAVATNWLLQVSGLGPAASWRDHQAILEGTRVEFILLLGVALLVFASLMARVININKFSLHAMYRNRLIRGYLGASNPRRNASKFTGFAESDNLAMHDLKGDPAPLPIVNVTLNLVSGQRLAWQQRKAESFTISPLHCGAAGLGYRSAEAYGGIDGITLGTAVAISGAAASPNMGYHSSPVIAFIMTLFNARLGCWLGNPGPAGEGTWRKAGPTTALGSLAREAFGLTNNSSKWVYLSDGGHFENLALYEMVRRRCRYIFLLDGGCDPGFTYGDLGNALRKIRIDLKIPVEFDETSFAALREKSTRYAYARIRYSNQDDGAPDGYLIYFKPMIRGNEPPDVGSYQNDHTDFPHETTANQFFNESQTESYRALGQHTVGEVCRGWDRGEGLAGLAAYLSGGRRAAAANP